MILVLSLIIISFTLTICLKLLLNKYYYTDQKQDNMIENQNQQIATSGVVEISEEKEVKAKAQKPKKKKVNKTWEAFGKLKGSLIVNDPKFLL